MSERKIEKVLSANDTGKTGGHQSGILVPKNPSILGFFPGLDGSTKNPRSLIDAVDHEGRTWQFAFIYYNNRFFGGTRNEYRLTGMTAFFRAYNLKPGDVVIFHRKSSDIVHVSFRKEHRTDSIITVGHGWKVIQTHT